MKHRLIGLALSGLAALTLTVGVNAEGRLRISNVAGKIVHFNHSTGIVHLKTEKGNTWIVQMMPKSKYERNKKDTNSSAFHEGDQVAVGITSSLAESPKQAVLMVDWGNSGAYVATTAAAPYQTRMGDFASSGGVASANNVGAQRPDTTIGILGNGGKLPPPNLDNPNGTQQSVPGDPKGQSAQPLTATNPPLPGANTMSTNRAPYMAPMQNMNVDPYSTGLPSGTSLMGIDGEDGGSMRAPSQGGMATGGTPVQIQAVIMQANPGSHQMVVQQAGSNTPLNIMVGANVNIANLRPGQKVMIMGQASPNGYIEANSVMPINP